jgi:hypothetical protein
MFNFIKNLLGIGTKSKAKDCCSTTTTEVKAPEAPEVPEVKAPEVKAPEVKVAVINKLVDSGFGTVETTKGEPNKSDKPKSKKRRYYKKPNKKKGE